MDFNAIRQNRRKPLNPQNPPPPNMGPNGYNLQPPPYPNHYDYGMYGGGGSSYYNGPPYTYEESGSIRCEYRDAPPYVDSYHHQYYHPGGAHYGQSQTYPTAPPLPPAYHQQTPPLYLPPPPPVYAREPPYHERYYYPPPSYGGMFSDENPNACSIM